MKELVWLGQTPEAGFGKSLLMSSIQLSLPRY